MATDPLTKVEEKVPRIVKKSNNYPTLSACLIVKNEEHNLERCLSSIVNVVDEIVVVDTGSTDRTMDIARSFGACLYEHPWEENFSKHRNQSISYATKDWVMIIDADEELVLGPGGVEVFRLAIRDIANSTDGGHLAAAVVADDIQSGRVAMKQNTARLFKRGHIRYNGIVHNQAVMDSKASLIEESIAYLRHYGYDLTFVEMQQKKTARTLPMVLKWMKDEPDNYHPHFYLTQIYMESGDTKKAIEHGEIYLSHKKELEVSGHDNFNRSIYYSMFSAYMRLERFDDANRWLTEGLKEDPVNIDLAFALVQFGVRSNQHHLVYMGANQFVNLYNAMKNNPLMRQNRFMYSCNAESYCYCLYQLALSQFRLGLDSIMKLKDIASDASDFYRNGLLADLKSELFNLGLEDFANRHIRFNQANIIPSLVDELMTKNPEIFH